MQRKHCTVNLNTNELSNVHMLPPKPVEIDEDTPVIFLDSSNPAISQPQIANTISSIDPTPSTLSAATPFVAASSSKNALKSTPTQRYLKSPRKQSTMSLYVPKKITPSDKSKIDSSIMKFIAWDVQPFSVVEDKGFKI